MTVTSRPAPDPSSPSIAADRRRLLRWGLCGLLALPAVALTGCAGSGTSSGSRSGADSIYRGGGSRENGSSSNRGNGR